HHPSCADGPRYVRDKTRPIVITVAAPTPSCSRTPTAASRWRHTPPDRAQRDPGRRRSNCVYTPKVADDKTPGGADDRPRPADSLGTMQMTSAALGAPPA